MAEHLDAAVARVMARTGDDRLTALARIRVHLDARIRRESEDAHTLASVVVACREVREAMDAELASWWPERRVDA